MTVHLPPEGSADPPVWDLYGLKFWPSEQLSDFLDKSPEECVKMNVFTLTFKYFFCARYQNNIGLMHFLIFLKAICLFARFVLLFSQAKQCMELESYFS